jgi:membrane-bound ClpP family serine protease
MTNEQLKNFIIHPVTIIVLGVLCLGLTIDTVHSWTLGILGGALIITGCIAAARKYGNE